MLYKENRDRTIHTWNNNSSIFTVLIYVLYGVFHRWLDIPLLFYLLAVVALLNMVGIARVLHLIPKNTEKAPFSDKRFAFAAVRLLLNGILIYLILAAATSG
ncbi:MAG: hypothetical protein WD398_06310 [Cyclobacteriaceae bacterium]